MKRIIFSMLILTLTVMPVCALAAADVGFGIPNDVVGHHAADSIMFIASRNALPVDGQGRFLPDSEMSNGSFYAMLAKLFGYPLMSYQNMFSDMPADGWYGSYIQACVNVGTASGWGGTIRPDEAITPIEAAVALIEHCKYRFKDVPRPPEIDGAYALREWAEDYVLQARYLAMSADAELKSDTVTKAQAAVMLCNVYNYINLYSKDGYYEAEPVRYLHFPGGVGDKESISGADSEIEVAVYPNRMSTNCEFVLMAATYRDNVMQEFYYKKVTASDRYAGWESLVVPLPDDKHGVTVSGMAWLDLDSKKPIYKVITIDAR